MYGWFRDARYALRQLVKTPAFTLTAIVTLALGIGANTTIFSWINSTLLSPLPGASPRGAPVAIKRGDRQLSYPDFVDLRTSVHSVSALVAWTNNPIDLTSEAKPQRLWAQLTTANFFDALGVRPYLGHFFESQKEDRPGGSPVAVLSYRTWQLLFDADPQIIGRTIHLNQHPFTVIGVAPPLFQGATSGLRMDVWAPLLMNRQLDSASDLIHDRGDQSLNVIGILAPGTTRAQAQQELTLQMQQLARAYPETHLGSNDMLAIPLWRAPDSANQYLSAMLPPLMAIALVVLLLACVNLANLFLVRGIARRREMAVRLSLGANRVRLVRQMLVESVLVALVGGGLALFVTLWSAGSFDRFLPPSNLPVNLNMHVDQRVLIATFLLSTLTGIAFGLLPAMRSSSVVPVTVLKEETGTTSGSMHKARLTSALVCAQIALSFLLLVSGGLFIRSFRHAQNADPGFRADHVLLSTVDLFPAGYTAEKGVAFQRELLNRIDRIPGVRSASFSNWSPLSLSNSHETIMPEGYVPQRDESLSILAEKVAPNYLETLGIPLVAGRDISDRDTPQTQGVAVVNEKFVQQYWPGQNPLGMRVKVAGEWLTVVGVAKNAKYLALEESAQPLIYWSALQRYRSYFVLQVLVKGDPNAYAAPVVDAVHSLDPELPVLYQYPLSRNVETASTGARVAGTFVGLFGLIGLTLAAIGVYGVISYSTRQRLHEIGIRMALGAKRRDVLDLVLKQGVQLAAVGIAGGVIFSLLLTPLLRSQLYQVSPSDFATYLCVAILLAAVTLAACFIPARKAASVEPLSVLRCE